MGFACSALILFGFYGVANRLWVAAQQDCNSVRLLSTALAKRPFSFSEEIFHHFQASSLHTHMGSLLPSLSSSASLPCSFSVWVCNCNMAMVRNRGIFWSALSSVNVASFLSLQSSLLQLKSDHTRIMDFCEQVSISSESLPSPVVLGWPAYGWGKQGKGKHVWYLP